MDTQNRLLAYLKPHYKLLFLGLFCAAVTAGITASIGLFIDHAFNAIAAGKLDTLSLVCWGVIGAFFIKGVFGFGQNYFLSLVSNRVATKLRDDIYAHLQHLSLAYFNKRRTGAIMSVLTNDVPAVQNATMSLKDVAAAPTMILFSAIMLFRTSWQLTLVALVFIPFMALVISRISKRLRGIQHDIQDRLSDVTTVLEETVAGVRIIKSFSTENHEIARFHDQNVRSLKAIMRGVRKSAQLRPITELIGALGIALVLFLGGQSVAKTNLLQQQERTAWIRQHPEAREIPGAEAFPAPRGGMKQGGLFQFLYLLNTLARSVSDIGGIMTLRAAALAASKRIFDEVLDQKTEVGEKPDAQPLRKMDGHIRFENVRFRYSPDGPDVLQDVSFEVKPGEVVALVGKSGSGKSTLVDLIPRFYDTTAGRILVDGIDVRDVKLETLRRQIGIVPQETWLFAGTLRDNIAYGNRDAGDEDVRAAAYAANAFFVESMPQGYETVVGDRGIRLSGGEKQRIAIARAILMNPRLLILDEATSSLDASSESLVQEALDELMKGRTTIVIAHRLSTIVNADRILAMQDGQIIEMGSHRELLARGGYYARLYETQSRGFE